MKFKKITAIAAALALAAMSLTGCTGGTQSAETAAPQAEQTDAISGSYTVKVTAIDGETVTAAVGTLAEMTVGGDMPSGGNMPDGTPPAMPENSDSAGTSSSETPPAMPEGDSTQSAPSATDGGMGGMSGMPAPETFTESGETVTFTLDGTAAITVEAADGTTAEGTTADITVGSVLTVTVNNGTAEEITVEYLAQGGMDAMSGAMGGGMGESTGADNGTAAETISEDTAVSGASYSSTGDDENALRIDGAEVTLEDITVEKSAGESSSTENGDFYGTNAAVLAQNGATVTIRNATVTTDAVNGNGVFSYGENTVVNIYSSVIRTKQHNSGGIQTTGGGTTNAYDLDVETEGNSSAAIRSDRGGGTVNVDGGTYVTNGTGSPAVYSTASITVKNATLTANASEAAVVEGKNSVSLEGCTVTGNMSGTYADENDENIHNIMIYQSMSGDADVGTAAFSAKDSTVTSLSGDMFYITNTNCTIDLENVVFELANDVFLRIEGNSSARGWGTEGANGGACVLTAVDQTISGRIIVDAISSLKLSFSGNSSFTGSINEDGAAGEVAVTLGDGCTWKLTGDCYITSFTGDISNVDMNGFTLYVNGVAVTQ